MKIKTIEPHQSSIGIDSKIISIILFTIIAVAYIFNFGIVLFVPIVLFFVEKRSNFVKYQSALAFIIVIIQSAITQLSPFILFLPILMQAWILVLLFDVIIKVIFTIVHIYIIYHAYRYKQIYFPQIANIVDKFCK